mmetsp:Transcript_19074/g.21964  ORF Transcript_19074/g.21964 Transcript_19074/m.21964 type:complete len:104 (+) Transcript_19074:1636-1947(+)
MRRRELKSEQKELEDKHDVLALDSHLNNVGQSEESSKTNTGKLLEERNDSKSSQSGSDRRARKMKRAPKKSTNRVFLSKISGKDRPSSSVEKKSYIVESTDEF